MIITSKFTEEQEIQFLRLIRPNIVEILREKKGVATLIRFNDQQYVVQHPSHMRSNQNLKKKAK
ncbi:hypothetical protein [Psychrobacillus lasiicapitis]|uniref:Uncharacterized protein n=1 Tax=Psychrobacillus lasiicapitis TaxID=1636719 RepID=A0A544TAG8_9BACI|nr:hypothetical protein [Psychrobacillus lasiicapitis]TQR14376.1 hypothetical protein FG382_07925 [Psychrobacillus lasiicapitis]GGA31871.1 hypothetical protein GCM10011384_21780 [Psychrobacillus lasiicapitis]